MNPVGRWLRRGGGRQERERELLDEIAFHLSEEAESRREAGATEAEAHAAARRMFGSTALTTELASEAWTWPLAESLAQDARYALRVFARHRAFTVTCLITLAVTLGPLTAMIAVLRSVLFAPLPYRQVEQLVIVGADGRRLQAATIRAWRQEKEDAVAFFDPVSMTRTDTEPAQRISVIHTSPNLLSLLGMAPLAGRMFTREEAEEKRAVAIISERYWREHFAASANLHGLSIVIDTQPWEIVGVLPATLAIPAVDGDLFVPHTFSPSWDEGTDSPQGNWFALARLTGDAGATRQRLRAIEASLYPTRRDAPAPVPLTRYLVDDRTRTAVWLLAAVALVAVVIAAGNLASLALARTSERSPELTTRWTLGAAPTRLVRQLVTEHAGLALVAGVVAVPAAATVVAGVRVFGPARVAHLTDARLDPTTLAWAALWALSVGAALGLVCSVSWRRTLPAVRGASPHPFVRRLGRALAMGEFALALAVMICAGLLARSWWQAVHVDLGFHPERVLSLQLAAPQMLPAERRSDVYAGILETVRSLPAVDSAAIIGDLFVQPPAERAITADDAGTLMVPVRIDEVSESFFSTLGIPLERGRTFTDRDLPSSPRVVIVNRRLAERVWPGLDPIGRRLKFGRADASSPWLTIVGVVGDMRRQGAESEPAAQMFEPLAQNPSRLETLLIRTATSDPMLTARAVTAAIGHVARETAVYDATTVQQQLDDLSAERRFQSVILAMFSLLSLLLAVVGLFGVTHYAVATRTFEIGLRRALGATPRAVVRGVLGDALRVMAVGMGIGVIAAVASTRLIGRLLFEVSPLDGLTLAAAASLLGACGLLAAYLPARRAAAVEPSIALRGSL